MAVDITHLDAVASISADSAASISASSAASSTCSTPASSISGSSGRTGRTLRSGRTTSLGLAPILPLSVSTRSMARTASDTPQSAAKATSKLSGIREKLAAESTGRKAKRKATGASKAISVFDENTESARTIGVQASKTAKIGDTGPEKKVTAAHGDRAQTGRAPLTMTQNAQNSAVSRPAPAAGVDDKGPDISKVKAMQGKRKAEGAVYEDMGPTGLKKRARTGTGMASGSNRSGKQGHAVSALPKHQDNKQDHDNDEDDEPLPARFASLRHRPPTPPRMMSLDDRRKSMAVSANMALREDRTDLDMSPTTEAQAQIIFPDVELQQDAVDGPDAMTRPSPSMDSVPATPVRTPIPAEDIRMTPEDPSNPTTGSTCEVDEVTIETPSRQTSDSQSSLGSPSTASRSVPIGLLTPARQQSALGVSPRKTPGLLSRFGTPRRFAPLPRGKNSPLGSVATSSAGLAGLASGPIAVAVAAETATKADPMASQGSEVSGTRTEAAHTATNTSLAVGIAPGTSSSAAVLPPPSRIRPVSSSRGISGTALKPKGLMPPPSLPTRSLRSSNSSRTLVTMSAGDDSTGSAAPLAPGAQSRSSQSTLPRSSTLYASTISSAAKTSLPPPAISAMGTGAGSRKRAPLGEARRPGMPSNASSSSGATKTETAVRARKPSYPSSLSIGNGQPGISRPTSSGVGASSTRQIGRPRDRTLSGPVPASVLASFRTEGPNVDLLDGGDPDEMEQGVTVAPSLGSPKRPSPLRGSSGGSYDHSAGPRSALAAGAGSPGRRVVSEPIHPIRRAPSSPISDRNGQSTAHPLAASTSAAGREPRESLGLSMSERRQGAGWNDTSKSFVGLAAALERLKRKDSMVGKGVRASLGGSGLGAMADSQAESLSAERAGNHGESGSSGLVVSDRLAAVHRPRHSIAVGPSSSSLAGPSKTGSTAESSATGSAQISGIPRAISRAVPTEKSGSSDIDPLAKAKAVLASRCLKGVVAVVDVWTADGADSSAIFEDMLRNMGARVLAKPSDSVTHLIYKSGKASTLTWYRKAAAAAAEAAEDAEHKARLAREEAEARGMALHTENTERLERGEAEDSGRHDSHVGPYIVGLSWVTRCKAEGQRVGEEKFAVDVKQEDVFGKRRKSMDPKAFNLSERLAATPSGRAPLSALSQVSEARRKTMLYAQSFVYTYQEWTC